VYSVRTNVRTTGIVDTNYHVIIGSKSCDCVYKMTTYPRKYVIKDSIAKLNRLNI